MFDRVTDKPRHRRWQTLLIVVSAVAHGGLLAGLVVSAMWKIQTLPVNLDHTIEVGIQPPQAAASPPPAGHRIDVLHPVVKVVRVVKEDVQPVKELPKTLPTTGSTSTTGDTKKDGGGGDGTDPNAKGKGDGTCVGPKCSEIGDQDKIKHDECEDPDPPERCRPPIVPPTVAKGLRTSGSDQIFPPDGVRVDMVHDGKDQVRGTFQVCVSSGGRVDNVRIMKSTGYQAYDDLLVAQIRNWGYRPYMVGKRASPMCTVVVFSYHMHS